MKIIEQKITTILRPTGINLAPYVINPYQGCQMGCLFCYAQFSKKALKEELPWGQYVKVKINALEVLERELDEKNPEKVLLGSTTECFQAAEKKYGVTEAVLKLLNQRKIKYIILTRSLLVCEYISLLGEGNCEAIYFTIDTLPGKIRECFEPYAVSVEDSVKTANLLAKNNIPVIAYFCPVMPELFEFPHAAEKMPGVEKAEFEIMNFKMAGIPNIIKLIKQVYPEYVKVYERLGKDREFYGKTVIGLKTNIQKSAQKYFRDIKIHSHAFEDFFQNKY
ncbi:MAG: radical SAM protein [Candidatus Omnitrophota bacterium]